MGLSEEEKKLRGEMTKHELKMHMVKLREERERKKQDKLRVKEEKLRAKEEKLRVKEEKERKKQEKLKEKEERETKKQEKLKEKEEKERKKQEKIDKKKKLVEVESSPVNSDTEEVGGSVGGSVNENVDREEVGGSVNENVDREEVGGSVDGSVNENVELLDSENEESDTEIEVIVEPPSWIAHNNEGSYYTFEQYQEAQIV